MFSKQHRFTRLAGSLAAAALLVPAAQAGAQDGLVRPLELHRQASATGWGKYGVPRAMPSDYAAHFAAQIEPGDYGMPRPLPADYEPVGGTSGGNGFDWADAGIGAGAAFGLVLLTLAAAVSLRRGGRLEGA